MRSLRECENLGGKNFCCSIEKSRAYSFVKTLPNLMSSNFSALSQTAQCLTSFEKLVNPQLQQEQRVVERLVVFVLDLAAAEA